MWAVGFDLSRSETVGDPVPVQEGVVAKAQGAANFSISDNGHLVYMPGGGGAALTSRLVVTERDGVGTSMIDITGYDDRRY